MILVETRLVVFFPYNVTIPYRSSWNLLQIVWETFYSIKFIFYIKCLMLHSQKKFWSMVCLSECFILYLYRYENIMNSKANKYNASTLIFRCSFLYLLFSNIEGRMSGRLNIVGHVKTVRFTDILLNVKCSKMYEVVNICIFLINWTSINFLHIWN